MKGSTTHMFLGCCLLLSGIVQIICAKSFCNSDTILITQCSPFNIHKDTFQNHWDFSNIKDSIQQIVIVQPIDSIHFKLLTTTYRQLFQCKKDTLSILSYETPHFYIYYDRPLPIYHPALLYKDSLHTLYSGQGEYGHLLAFSISGKNDVRIDDIGRLYLPTIQLDSVYRLHTKQSILPSKHDSVHVDIETYHWRHSSYPYPLCIAKILSYMVHVDTFRTSYFYYLPIDSTQMIKTPLIQDTADKDEVALSNILNEVSFLPNPVHDNLSISYCLTRTATIYFSLHSSTGLIYWQTSPSEQGLGKYQQYVDMSTYPIGTYVLYIYVDDYVLAETIIKG